MNRRFVSLSIPATRNLTITGRMIVLLVTCGRQWIHLMWLSTARPAMQLRPAERSVDRSLMLTTEVLVSEIPKAAALTDGGGVPPIYYRMVRVRLVR